ncbi:hypothetical protein IC582_024336 [Cucumis melo]
MIRVDVQTGRRTDGSKHDLWFTTRERIERQIWMGSGRSQWSDRWEVCRTRMNREKCGLDGKGHLAGQVYEEEVYENFPFIEANCSKLKRMHSGCWSNYSKVQFMLQWKNCIWLKEMKKLRFEFVLESKRARLSFNIEKY